MIDWQGSYKVLEEALERKTVALTAAISKIADAQQTIENLNDRIKTLEHLLKVEQDEVRKARQRTGAGRWM